MCFSAEASFTASALLTGIGATTVRSSPTKAFLYLAIIPFFFAIQQFSEGVQWLALSHYHIPITVQHAFIYSFLTFALLIWPIWMPLAFAKVELNPQRRTLMYVILCCGLILSILNLMTIWQQDIRISVATHSLQYTGAYSYLNYVYPFIVLIPFFISTLQRAKLIGLLYTVGLTIAYYFYESALISVWCFFAAIASLGFYFLFKENHDYASVKEKIRD